jgi:hypothetical protein
MNNKDQYGDFTVMDDFVNNLMGESSGGVESGSSFPIMDPPKEENNDEEDEEAASGEFKDERSIKEEEVIVSENEDEKEEEDSKEEQDDEENINTSDDTEKDEDTPDKTETDSLGDAEPEITAYVQEKLFDKLGWELTDEDVKTDISSLIDYMEQIVEANSKPSFATEEIAKLNDFVTQGGKLSDYFQTKGELDLDAIDLNMEFNQKAIVTEFLKEEGYNQSQIDKKIKRYDESGILEEEALEAKDSLSKIRQKKADKLLQEQKEIQDHTLKQQQQFYNDVSSTIDKLDNIKGIKPTATQKNKLKDALLKVDKEGKTLYHKMYSEDPITNLIESAFFTLNKDTILKDLTKKAESKATQNLKKKLETKTKRGKNSGSYDEDYTSSKADHSALDTFSNFIKPS